MTVEALLDDLGAALVAAGAPPPRPPKDPGPLRELEAEIAPLRLPGALRAFWLRVDAGQLALDLHPRPASPAFALNSWRRMRDSTLPSPLGLFPWCYESHQHLLIELEGPGATPGTIFEWWFAGSDYHLRFTRLEDWLELAAATVRAGATADIEGFRQLAEQRLDERGPHPVYGLARSFEEEPSGWPAHWAPLMELARRDPPARFAGRSVAEVHAARRLGPVQAMVSGSQLNLAASPEGRRIRFTDDTGFLDLWCPASIRGFGYLDLESLRIELEAEHWTAPRPAVDWAGVVFSDEHPLASFKALLDRFPPDATAAVIHRVP
jgi:hypothetical protein